MAPNPPNETTTLLGTSKTKTGSGSAQKTETAPRPLCSAPCRLLSAITVEPALLLLSVSYGIELIFKTNLLVDKTCAIQLHYPAEVCRDLDSGSHKAQQDATQRLVTSYNLYCQVIELLPGALITLLLGAWSDTRGRRLPLLLPLAGATLKTLGLFCNAYWWSLQPWYVLLAFIPFGLSGGMMASFMAAFAYVSDSSCRRSRTSRLSIASMALFLGLPIGNIVGAALYSHGGYVAVFGFQFIITFLSLVYSMVRLHNIMPESIDTTAGRREWSPVSQLRRSLAVVARRREGGGRACILGHMSCIGLCLVTYGTTNFLFLYTRKKFMWNYAQYSLWNTVNLVVTGLVSCVILPLLSLRLGIEDSLLAFVGSASHSFFDMLVGTAPKPFFLYVAVLLSSAGGIVVSCSRGALSKLVAPDELGAVFSVVGLFESLAPLITSPLYTLTYNYTIDLYPGTVFVLSASVSLVICCIYTWILTAFPAAASPVDTRKEKGTHHLPA